MKNLLSAIFFALLLAAVFSCAAGAQTNPVLKFTDDAEKQISSEYRGKKIVSLKTIEKQAIVTYGSMGKAVRIILGDLPKKTTRETDKLLENLSAATTAYYLSQGDKKFYIAVSNSVDDRKLRDCDNCKVRCRLKLLEIRSSEGAAYISLIVSIKKI